MATGSTLLIFTPLHNEPPDASAATFDLRNFHPVLDFDGAANEEAVFSSVMPQEYGGGGVDVLLHIAVDGTTGDMYWDAQFERIGSEQQDIDVDGFATVQSLDNTTVPAVSGNVKIVTIAFTNAQIDGLLKGESFRLKVIRDAVADSNTDDAQLTKVELREA